MLKSAKKSINNSWERTQVQCLLHNRHNGLYYGRFKVSGKQKWFNQAGGMPTFFSKTNPGPASWYSRPHLSGLLSLIHPNVSTQGPPSSKRLSSPTSKVLWVFHHDGSFTMNPLLTE